MDYDIRVAQQTSTHLAVVRRIASLQELPTVVPDACGTVWKFIQASNTPDAGRNVAIYLDDKINLEIGVEVAAPITGDGEVVASSTPSGKVAATTHFGPYNQLHRAHDALRTWCNAGGLQLAGPNWEIYGHWQEEWNDNPDKISTEIYYLLKPHVPTQPAPP